MTSLSGDSLTQHPDFWYSDGSVVLIVENTSFKIHQSILMRHSDVFADVFAVPQPGTVETIEGCPIVHLPDSLTDFVDTLSALYKPFHFDDLPSDADLSTLITFISGILRVATKYNLLVLRQKCIAVLRRKFPSTLTGCDGLLTSHYQYRDLTAIVHAIPLAREANVPEVLPLAFYISTHIPVNILLEDDVLSWKDKALCLAGKERLWEEQKTKTHVFLFSFTRCAACPRSTSLMGWRDAEALRSGPHPLEQYTKWSALNLCPRCTQQVESIHRSGREELWEKLPGIFQLGTWEKIYKDQNC